MRSMSMLVAAVAATITVAAPRSEAVSLRELSRGVQEQAAEGQQPPPPGCVVSGSNDVDFDTTPSLAAIGVTSRAEVSGTACDEVSLNTATTFLAASLVGGPAGTPVQLCLIGSYAGAAPADGPRAAANVRAGGNPVADPGQILINAAPVFLQEATFMSDQQGGDTVRTLVTAAVGDTIEIRNGTEAQASVLGEGTARGFVTARLEVHIGTCPIERAPSGGSLGLGLLAAALFVAGLRRVAR